MAEAASSIFNKKAADKLRNPDDLDKYLQVTNPSVWVALAACAALLVGLLSWGFFGSVTTSVSAASVVSDGKAMCFLTAEDVAKVNVGDIANVNGKRLQVAQVASIPLSRNEAGKVLSSDYLVSALVSGDWAYQVVFEGDVDGLANGVPLATNITVERIAPITLIARNGA